MNWFQNFFRKSEGDDAAEEMRAHLELYADQLEAQGRTPEDARREARLKFGNPRVKQEEVHALNRRPALDVVFRELRFAVRSLRKSPAFTATVVTVLALAIGASAVVFAIVDTTILRGLPFEQADRLVAVGGRSSFAPTSLMPMSAAHFLGLKARVDVFDMVAAVTDGNLVLRSATAEPQSIQGQRVTADFFNVLRVAPAQGRLFTSDNETEGRHRVAVISHGLWQRLYGGAADVIGQRLSTEQGEFEVIGIMPARFSYPVDALQPTDIWAPYVIPENERVPAWNLYLQAVARLHDGVSLDDALARINDELSGVMTLTGEGLKPGTAIRPLLAYITGGARPWLMMLFGAATCVLFIACVNVANLVLVRTTVRSHELRIRTALGATRWDIARALLTESLLLSIAGTALGVLLAWSGMDALRALMPSAIPRQAAITFDPCVLAAAAIAAGAIGVMLGLAPILQHLRSRNGNMRVEQNRANTTSRPVRWLRSMFVVAEVALSVVLLVGAVLFLTSFSRVMNVDLGFDYRNVALLRVQPAPPVPNGASGTASSRSRLLAIVDRLSALHGVEAAAIGGTSLPLSFGYSGAPVDAPGRNVPTGGLTLSQVSSDYFRALRIPLRRGRAFTDTDVVGSELVTILNEEAATQIFGTDDPIGQVIGFVGSRRIVGVAGNVRGFGPEQDAQAAAYIPVPQSSIRTGTLLVRAARVDDDLTSQIRAMVRAEFPDIVIPPAGTLEESLSRHIAVRRFNMLLLTLFGALGLTMAAVGIYGVLAYVVSQRTREIGIRKALGALPSRILWSVLGRASAQIGAGLVIGLSLSWLLAGLVASFLFEVEAREVGLYAIAASVLVVVGIAAAAIPARRAARVDPVIALRSD